MKALILTLLGCLTAVAVAQESATSRPGSNLELPVSDQGKPFEGKDAIVVDVLRAGPDAQAGAGAEVGNDWRFRVGGKTYGTTRADLSRFVADLRILLRPKRSAQSGRALPAFLIRADAEAPYACITTLMAEAEAPGSHRVFFAVRKTDGAEQAIECPSPLDPGKPADPGAPPETRVNLKWFEWRPLAERVVVTAADWSVTDGEWGSKNEATLNDHQALTKTLSTGATKNRVLINVDPEVPWQRAIDVVGAAQGAGRSPVQFMAGGRLSGGGLIGIGSGGGLGGAGGAAPGAGGGGGVTGMPPGGTRISRRNTQARSIQATEKVVMAGLEWLKRHQMPDGSWSCDRFSNACAANRGAACMGGGSAAFDPGVTGLALLAFLGAGFDSQRPGPYLDTVRNGLKYLKNIQDAQGCFGPTADNRYTYSHACATMAMCEAFASSKQLPWRKSAEQAVAFILECQNPSQGWRYGKQPGDNDASVTGWMLMALFAAREAGVPFDEGRAKQGIAFLDSITDEATGRTGYIKKGELPVRPEALQAQWPPSSTESLTALSITVHAFWRAPQKPSIKAGAAELLSKRLPVWDEGKGAIDMYYWYWGTMAMFQLGGPEWERWDENLKTALIDHQLKKGCAEGSWDPKDPWGTEGGRVYSTALMTLCLEAYYRYPKR